MKKRPLTAADRLLALSIDISKAHSNNFERQLVLFQQAVYGDPELMAELLTPAYMRDAARKWLNLAASNLRALQPGHVTKRGAGLVVAGPKAKVKAEPVTHTGDGVRFVEKTVLASLLDTFEVNGRPVGDVPVAELRGWTASRRRDARFVELLISGLPEDAIPRDYHRPSDVEKLYKQAEADYASAA